MGIQQIVRKQKICFRQDVFLAVKPDCYPILGGCQIEEKPEE
jgi:hypothetical protein